MKEEIKLTREQVASFAFLGIIGNVVYSHTYIDDFADRAAWLAALAGILLLIPFAVWILYLGGKHSGCTIFDILGKGIGKIPAGIACIIFIFINAAVAAVQLNMFTEMLKVFFFTTDTWYCNYGFHCSDGCNVCKERNRKLWQAC